MTLESSVVKVNYYWTNFINMSVQCLRSQYTCAQTTITITASYKVEYNTDVKMHFFAFLIS